MSMNSKMLEFASWEPDSPLYAGAQTTEARNCIPAKRGYRAMHGLAAMKYTALDGQCLGAHSVKNGDSILTVASTASGIYSLEAGSWTSRYAGTPLTSTRDFVDYGSAVYALLEPSFSRAP